MTALGKLSLFPSRGSPFSVESARENVDDCHEIFSKLLFGAFVIAALNDESATSLIDDPFDDFGCKTSKSVLVGNHNRFDCSALDVLQKPREPFSFVVES